MLRMMQVLSAFPLYMGPLFPLHVGLSQTLPRESGSRWALLFVELSGAIAE